MANRVGEQLGNYRLVRLLGQGSFAEVYLGEHRHLKTEAAVKVLRAQLTDEDAENFLNEARIIARLVHPNIVRIFDFDVQEDGTSFLVMDYAPSGTLRHRHPRGVQVPLGAIVYYVKQVASALQYAHDHKLVHRDVKPENMLVGRHNEILLSDFGIAQTAQSTNLESAQKIAGTVAYMSPEQLQGKTRISTDQYALGIVVYEWLTGDRPFQGSFSEMASQHLFATPPPLRKKVSSIPPAVEEVVMKALTKDPKQRFVNVQTFANALEQASLTNTFLPSASEYTPPIPAQPTVVRQPGQLQEQISAIPTPSIPVEAPILTDPPVQIQQQPFAVIPIYSVQPIGTGSGGSSSQRQDQAALSASSSTSPSHANLDQPIPSIPPGHGKLGLRSFPSKGKVILLIGLALLLVASGLGLAYLIADQVATTNAQARAAATAQANTRATASVIAANASATASVIAANPNPYPPGSGTLVLYDPLRDDSSSGWDKGSTNCAFLAGAYHVSATGISHFKSCVAQATNFSNFAYEVQMKILQGDVGGMIFRADSANNTYYLFFVAQNGYYSLYACAGKTCLRPLVSKFSPAINQGLNKSNLLAVVAMGTTITLYANHQQLASVNDSTYNLGQIGLVASPYANTNDPTEVVYSNARVWSL